MMKRWRSIIFVMLLFTACQLPGNAPLQQLGSLDSFAHDITFSPNGEMLAMGTLHEGAKIWRVSDKTLVASLGEDDIRTVAFSPDGQLLVTGGGGEVGTVRIWRLDDYSLVQTLDPTLTAWVQSVDISPDGLQLAVGTSDHVYLFNFADGSLLHTFDMSGMQVAFAPDGQQLAIAENLPIIRLWNPTTHEEVGHLPGHGFSIAYSSDSMLFATPGWNNQGMVTFQGAEQFAAAPGGENEVQIWNVADGKHVRAINTHDGQIHALAFSPHNDLLVSGGNDNVVRLARVADGTEIANVKLDRGVDSIAFSPDGTVVAISIYQNLYLWPIKDIVPMQEP